MGHRILYIPKPVNKNLYIAGTGNSGYVLTSTDGINWTKSSTNSRGMFYAIATNKNIWVAGGDQNKLFYSTDGINWNDGNTTLFNSSVNGITWNGTEFLAVANGTTNDLAYSSDGINWTGLGQKFSRPPSKIYWDGTRWIVGLGDGSSTGNNFSYSTDGRNWTEVNVSSTLNYYQFSTMFYDGSKWVGVGKDYRGYTIGYSTNLSSWSLVTPNSTIFSNTGNGVEYNGTKWVAVGIGGGNTIAYSSNGTSWTGVGKTIFSTNGRCLMWTGDIWIAGGEGTNVLAYSSDGINWTGLGTSFSSTSFTQVLCIAGYKRPNVTPSI